VTVSGYETPEIQDEWERHHYRDWSDSELSREGLHPDQFDEYRRAHIYTLEFPAREAWCRQEGHFPIDLEYSGPDICPGCYTNLTKLAASGQEIRFREMPNND
jgi:hypothetical protein